MAEVANALSGAVTPQSRRLPAGLNAAHGKSWSHANDHELDAVFGKLIRTVTAGESFGELALLQQNAHRTASVLTSPIASGQRDSGAISLLSIARKDYDAAVSPGVSCSLHACAEAHNTVT